MPPMVSAVQPSANVCCSKSVRKASKHGRSTSGMRATQTGAMRKTSASKERHEGWLERLYALKEVREGPFSADGIADQECKKIDGFIRSEAPAHQAHLMGKGFKQPFLLQVASHDDDESETTQAPRSGFQRWFGPQYKGWIS